MKDYGEPIVLALTNLNLTNKKMILKAYRQSPELSKQVSKFILRRPSSILKSILPPKIVFQVFLKQ